MLTAVAALNRLLFVDGDPSRAALKANDPLIVDSAGSIVAF